jgi:hypothetical protein
MNDVRIRAAAALALGLIVTVVTSAAVTCAPGGESTPKTQMASCLGAAQPCIASVAMDRCVQHEPSLTAGKTELLKAPARHASPQLAPSAPIALAVAISALFPVSSTGSPPGPARTVSHPTYILLSTLRI